MIAMKSEFDELGSEVTVVDSLIPDYGGNLYNVGDYYADFSKIREELG